MKTAILGSALLLAIPLQSALGGPTTPSPAPGGASGANNTFFVTWRDPREDAFQVGVPQGWQVGGGLMKGGQAYGSTDADGMSVANNPGTVGDMFATVYRALGIDPATQVRDAIGRPFSIAGGNGRPVEALF